MTALRWSAALALAAAVGARAEEPAAVVAAATPPAGNRQPGAVSPTELPDLDPAVRLAMRGTPASLPPVTAQLFHVGGRLEAQPVFQISVGDPFYRTALFGIRVEQHLDERWSIGAHALGGASILSAPVDVCTASACEGPDAGRLRSAPGKVHLMTGVELGWAPIYGKLSLAGEKTIHFDAYLSAGPELLLERIAPDAASPLASRWAVGARVGIGERVFFSNDFLLRVGVNGVVYPTRVRGQRELERKLSLELGVAWLFGGR